MLQGSSGRYYIGSTTDLQRRLEQHRSGHTYSTRRLGTQLELVASLEMGALAPVVHRWKKFDLLAS
jgi:predicted GIY-YIG superfamily endonuclease